ncbi:MAG: DUF1501 domain-containing protein [Verrucomicrobiales bacterium]|nr:DUF1501 domain-containing protein [Verrucomicrobiales bacterium]
MHSFCRRHMLQTASSGFGYLALSGLTQAAGADLTARPPRQRAKASRVIFLNMSGGPAQLDTFDYKPQVGKKPHPGSVVDFKRRGQSGVWVSDLLPNIARHADKLCVLNAMHADTSIHAQSMLQLHTGDRLRPCPSMGAWVAYGLGTENQNLPGFISLNTAKPAEYSAACLPPVYSGTPIGVNGEDMRFATLADVRGDHLPLQVKRRQLDLIQAMNRDHLATRQDDQQLEGVIKTMELGFRMQTAAPDLLDISQESAATLERYHVGKSYAAGTCKASDFGRQCLLARRFCEAGVRFIELNHGSWDQHTDHRRDLHANCASTDAPIAALLDDLDQRGLLEETLVVWGGEFGRPGLVPDNGKDESGHNEKGFTFWLAGGGSKGGYVHGRTSETGDRAVEDKVHFRDLHATILHSLGLKHDQLTFQHGGRRHRLTGPEEARVVHELFS